MDTSFSDASNNVSSDIASSSHSMSDGDTKNETVAEGLQLALPSLSFGYHYGSDLKTMHTSISLVLSGCQGQGVVERVSDGTIERSFLSNSLLLDPDAYSRALGLKDRGFLEGFTACSRREKLIRVT